MAADSRTNLFHESADVSILTWRITSRDISFVEYDDVVYWHLAPQNLYFTKNDDVASDRGIFILWNVMTWPLTPWIYISQRR